MKLGIDFGTCYSSAALLLEGIPTPINAPLTPGYSLPSSVFITEQGEILVGQVAENNRQKNPQSYRREFKRDLGSPDPYTLGNVSMLPEELVTEILKKLKGEAEKVAQGRGEKSLTNVLITVPATYSSYKRNLMQEAGEKAGFSKIQLLEEPVAAAIYYSRHGQINDGDIILVYDLGGGTFDATLMQKQGDKYQVLGMPKGLAYCGGTDFDRLIFQQLKQKCSGELKAQLEAKEGWRARAIVSDYCRDLKHQLSEQSTASVYIPMGLGQVESFELTRVEFEEMIAPLIEDTLDCCDQLVRSAGKNWQQVNRLLLVGGSSRIPYVKEAIEKRLEISPFLVDKPELAVCLGAAINDSIPKPKPEDKLREQKAIQQAFIQQAFEEREAKEREAEIKAKAENERKRKEEILRRREEKKQEAHEPERQQQQMVEISPKLLYELRQKGFYIEQKRQEVQSREVQHIEPENLENSERYLSQLLDTLKRKNFKISQKFDVYDQKTVYIAEGILEYKLFGLTGLKEKLISVLCLSTFENLSFDTWEKFSSTCEKYAIQEQLIYPVKRLEKGSQLCLFSPVAIVKHIINLDLIQRVKKVSPKAESNYGPMILPSIYDVESQLLIFPEGFHWFGAMGWDHITKNSLRNLLVK